MVYDFPSTSCVRKDHGASESSEHGFSVNFVKAVDDHSLSRTSRISSFPLNTVVEYPSTSGEEFTDYVVCDSPAANDTDVSFLSHSSFIIP